MFQTVTASVFSDAFIKANRADNFSYQAREDIFNYLEENYPDTELDVIAICCEYEESTPNDCIDAYSIDLDDDMDDDDKLEAVIGYMKECTSLISTPTSLDDDFVFAQF